MHSVVFLLLGYNLQCKQQYKHPDIVTEWHELRTRELALLHHRRYSTDEKYQLRLYRSIDFLDWIFSSKESEHNFKELNL